MFSLEAWRHEGTTTGPDWQKQFQDISDYPRWRAQLDGDGDFDVIEFYRQDEAGAWHRIPLPPV